MKEELYYSCLLKDLSAQDIVGGYKLENIDEQDALGETLLLNACSALQLDNAKYCLGLGANSNFVDDCGDAPLHSVIDHASGNETLAIEIIKLLLAHGADLELRAYMDKTPFLKACSRQSLAVIKFLVESGCDTSAKAKDLGGEFGGVYFSQISGLSKEAKAYIKEVVKS